MEFSRLIKERFSCREYSAEAVTDEQLMPVLEAGRLAPTAKNLQEQHIYVARSEKALAAIDSLTPCRYDAPVCLIVAFDKENVYTYPGGKRNSGIEDATIVATHLTLAASDCGMASCWVNNFDPDLLAQKLQLPANEEILMILAVGHPAPGAAPSPRHASRKPLSETVTEI